MEIEIKFPLHNPEQVITKLNTIAKITKQDMQQEDTYFVPAHRNFVERDPIKEWLRIRKTVKGAMLNYKNWHYKKGKTTHCDEYETLITNVEALERIFNSLNMNSVIVVNKKRSTWLLDGVEIAVDHVKELGWFIELEAKDEFESIEKATEHLHNTLGKLDAKVGEQDYKGYPYLLLEKNYKE